jgi:hypothetical protein
VKVSRLLGVAVIVAACSGEDQEAPEQQAPEQQPQGALCDGSSEVRFVAAKRINYASPHYEHWGLSHQWLSVLDGECNFWVVGYPEPWAVRRGVLSAQLADELSEELLLERWDEFESEPPSSVNQGLINLKWARALLTCPFTGCADPELQRVAEVAAALPETLGTLDSEPTAEGVLTVRRSSADGVEPLLAPAALEALLTGGTASTTAGEFSYFELDDADLLQWLRRERDAYLNAAPNAAAQLTDLTVSTSDGSVFGIAYRDRIPQARVDGLLPFLYEF